MSGKPSRDKGARRERELVAWLIKYGIPAHRVPLSGAQRGYPDDVIAGFPSGEVRIEVKARSQGFKRIYGWLADCGAVAFKGDRQEWVITMRLEDFMEHVGNGKGAGA